MLRTRPRGWAIAIAASIPLALAAGALPAAADSGDTVGVDSISIVNESGDTTFTPNSVATITANWSLPDGSVSPALIAMTMPRSPAGDPILQATPGQTFEITDAGQTVALCTVSSDGLDLTCPIDPDWLNAHPSHISGTLTFPAKVSPTAPHGTYVPVFGHVTANEITVTHHVWVPSRTSSKSAGPLQDGKGQIWWYVHVATPSSGWTAGETITIDDTLGDCQIWGDLTKAQYVRDTSANPTNPWVDVPSSDYTVTTSGDVRTTVITTRDAVAYRLVTTTVPTCGVEASPYENTASVGGTPVAGRWFWKTGGGAGSGGTGTFTLTKELAGTARDQVPADTVYTVNYSYTVPGDATPVADTLQIHAGETITSPAFPVTATVTLGEDAPILVDGAVWADAVFSRNDFQLSDQGTINVTLTNQLDSTIPPAVAPPADPAPVETAAVPPRTPVGSLAHTGSDVIVPIGVSAAALAAGAVALLFAHRRRRAHERA
ncbi:MAG TPA: DUF5979 domain-containing protein [Leifsonia sp.]|nr:DUF5979 domain-containing protein [Leifsonia sp.]